MKTQNQKRYLILLALVLVLAVQTVMMGYFGQKKAGYHVDEVYTYELSNYPGTFFSETEGFLDTWVDGSFFQESMSVDGLGDLDYSIPYHNQENDVHPPVYYFVIHTVSALFHGEVSKWIGILPNMFFCLLTTVLLYLVAARLFPNRVLALLVAAMWAWSVGAMTTAVFIRMYALLTCIATALVLVHLKALEDVRRGKLRKRTAALLFVVTLLGILTQYYFLVFCFFLCGIFFLYLCATRRWKLLGVYTVLEGGALCAAVVLFPKMLFHIFGGYRGKEAFGSMATKEGTLDGLKKVASTISRQLFNGWLKECILLVVAVVVVYFLVKHVLHPRLFPKGEEVGMAVEMDVHLDRKLRLHISHVDVAVTLLGVVAYVSFCMSGYLGKWETELKNPYIFMIPDTPLRKMWYATLTEHIKAVINGTVICLPIGLYWRVTVWKIIFCILIYVVIQANRLYTMVITQYLVGETFGKTGQNIIRMCIQMMLLGTGAGVAALAAVFINMDLIFPFVLIYSMIVTVATGVAASFRFEMMEQL